MLGWESSLAGRIREGVLVKEQLIQLTATSRGFTSSPLLTSPVNFEKMPRVLRAGHDWKKLQNFPPWGNENQRISEHAENYRRLKYTEHTKPKVFPFNIQ